jgi:small multidrug resistance pump
MPYLFLTVAFLLNATANILLKLGAKKGLSYQGVSLDTLSSNSFFVVGLLCFGLNVIFYFLALKSIPISIGYPIMVGMSLLIINAFALSSLHESITTMQLVGYVLLITGMTCVFYFSPNK